MRIAIPLYKGRVSGAYELSQTVSVQDLDVAARSIQDLGDHAFPKVADAPAWYGARGVQTVVVGTIDPDNAEILSNGGINVYMGAGEETAATIAARILGLLVRQAAKNAGSDGAAAPPGATE